MRETLGSMRSSASTSPCAAEVGSLKDYVPSTMNALPASPRPPSPGDVAFLSCGEGGDVISFVQKI